MQSDLISTEPINEENVRRAMKFSNSDVSLDDAVKSIREHIAETGEPFTMPNADLLVEAAMNTHWG